ncbi:MAG: hypothetical protein M3015_07590 [Bacteroidota bacterium]|nr:hypothetical protein [Bacteroidota bacterium]
MRKVREEMSNLYNTDKEKYFEEIHKAMTDFKAQRQTSTARKGIAASGADIPQHQQL